MRNRIALVLLAVAMLGATGCATVTEAGYYWGNYSRTLHNYTKAPSDETLTAHTAELERIITESKKRNLSVPPGIQAELGYIESRRGQNELAKAHYESEMQQYPESRAFLERLVASSAEKK